MLFIDTIKIAVKIPFLKLLLTRESQALWNIINKNGLQSYSIPALILIITVLLMSSNYIQLLHSSIRNSFHPTTNESLLRTSSIHHKFTYEIVAFAHK